MSKIESIKTYNGQDLDNIFFRPMLTGASAEELGIKVLYNMPVPTVLHFWQREGNILQRYSSCGWSGGKPADKYQKTIQMEKVKAEMSYSAEDYFSTVYELITGSAGVNHDDLSGTALEEAETALFRASIAESIRATMWYGSVDQDELNTFNGFVRQIIDGRSEEPDTAPTLLSYIPDKNNPHWAEELLKNIWESSSEQLRMLRSEGQLAFFVSSDVYAAYEESLNSVALEAAYLAKQNGRESLTYRGIPVIDVQLNAYRSCTFGQPHYFALLTDKRNLALAVNTADFPGTEVRMWYNPDQMENRQRAIFMAGCDYLLPELVTIAVGLPYYIESREITDTTVSITMASMGNSDIVDGYSMVAIDSAGDEHDISLDESDGVLTANYQGSDIVRVVFTMIFSWGDSYSFVM